MSASKEQPGSDANSAASGTSTANDRSWIPGDKGPGREGLSKGYGGSGGEGIGASGADSDRDRRNLTQEITNGPDKPGLLWAIAYPNRETVHFDMKNDALDATLLSMEEKGNGLQFHLTGIVASGVYKGQSFKAVYSVEGRTGTMIIEANR